MYNLFKKYQARDVNNIESFCAKYYKYDRFTGRGSEYTKAIVESHQEYINRHGFTLISHHDSVTGQNVTFYN